MGEWSFIQPWRVHSHLRCPARRDQRKRPARDRGTFIERMRARGIQTYISDFGGLQRQDYRIWLEVIHPGIACPDRDV